MFQIVIVEDSPAESYLLSRALAETGAPVRTIVLDDGLKAVEYITSQPRECDLVLLDLNLPKLNGFEVLDRLKGHRDYRYIPIVVLSGSNDPADIERCYRGGANAYICKPAHFDAITEMASELIKFWCTIAALPDKRSTLGAASVAR